MSTPATQGTTPAGLPYPESTGSLSQGANDIKALALALDPRAPFKQLEARELNVTAAAGVVTVTFAKPFTAKPVVVVSVYASGQSYVPLPGFSSITATGFTLFVAGGPVASTPQPIQGWGGALTIDYLAVGN